MLEELQNRMVRELLMGWCWSNKWDGEGATNGMARVKKLDGEGATNWIERVKNGMVR